MEAAKIQISTLQREEIIDISSFVEKIIIQSKIKFGICVIQSMHTTAGITINENADDDVKTDIITGLKCFDKGNYHHSEGNSPAHIKTSLIGNSATIIIEDGKPLLGTWQGIMFCEFDGPRERSVAVKIIPDSK